MPPAPVFQEKCRESKPRSQLPSVHSLSEISFIVDLGKEQGWFGPKKGVYLGLNTIQAHYYLQSQRCLQSRFFVGGTIIDGKLMWTDGTPTDFTLWLSDLMKHESSSNCVAIFSNLVFQQTRCSNMRT